MNQPRQRGPIARFFVWIWNAMNFTRRLAFNLLFFGFILVLLIAINAGGRTKPIQDRTTLVVAPEGRLVEQYSCDQVSRAFAQATNSNDCKEVQLRDVLAALEGARTDKRIERVLLRPDRMSFSGYASIREISAAIAALRAAGKQVIAFGENFEQPQYLLAAQADEVYLDPMGGLLLEGLGRYTQYFRQALQDKLGVDVHVFKVGEYKSAVEPFVLDGASPEAKEADLFWMNDVWQRYLGDVAKLRKLSPQQLAADVDNAPAGIEAAGGDLAKYALEHKLVDGLKTAEEVEALLAERGIADDNAEGGFRNIDLATYTTHLGTLVNPVDERPQVAIVVAEGEITGGEQPPGRIGGESTAALLRAARDDDKVQAVVLRVDSPGGEVFASEQIRREVVALRNAGKPVVASMGDLAASGGYWISMDADRIFADPSTITGSIGIFGMIPTIPRTLEKIGVHTDGVGTTRLAGAFDITRPLAPEVGQVVQSVIEKGYRDFTGKVAQARKQPVEKIDQVARGRVWSGQQARERGLVDAAGGIDAAVADAAQRARLGKPDSYRVRYFERPNTPFERFFTGLAQSKVGAAWLRESPWMASLLLNASPQAQRDLRFVQGVLQTSASRPVKALAYCFCGL